MEAYPPERPSTTINPDSFIDHGAMFDIIDGGGLDVTCLGMGELDELGNVNVSKLGSQLVGPGGFIDLTQSTRKVIFCGTFMGHAQLRIGDGRLTVEREGNIRKLVKSVGQITFNGGCIGPDQEVLYITERCVLRMLGGRLTVTEIAPGIDLQRDILSQMDFEPAVSDELKLMDPGLFCEHWGGLEPTPGKPRPGGASMILSENHLMIREMARQFAEKELTREVLDEAEATNSFRKSVLDQMVQAGLTSIKIPEEYGGGRRQPVVCHSAGGGLPQERCGGHLYVEPPTRWAAARCS